MIKIISWNIARRHAAWRSLADSDADIVLLQEAGLPPDDVNAQVTVDPAPFVNADGYRISFRSAIVRLSERVHIEWLDPVPLAEAQAGDFAVSHAGSISAAIVTPLDGEPFTVASFCAEYEKPHRSAGKMSWDIVDASLHRVISDLSLLIGRQRGHRVIAAGDLTVYFGDMERTVAVTGKAGMTQCLTGWRLLVCPSLDHTTPMECKPNYGRTNCRRTA